MHDEGNPNIDTTAAGTTAGSESEAAKGSAENAAGQGQQAEPQGEMTAEAVAALVQSALRDFAQQQQAQQTDNAPDCAPDRTGQDRTEFLRLRLCRTLALGRAFCRFFSCGFPCSQNFCPSTFFVIQSDGVLRRFSAFCGYSASIL